MLRFKRHHLAWLGSTLENRYRPIYFYRRLNAQDHNSSRCISCSTHPPIHQSTHPHSLPLGLASITPQQILRCCSTSLLCTTSIVRIQTNHMDVSVSGTAYLDFCNGSSAPRPTGFFLSLFCRVSDNCDQKYISLSHGDL
jgi:hypothetical protein